MDTEVEKERRTIEQVTTLRSLLLRIPLLIYPTSGEVVCAQGFHPCDVLHPPIQSSGSHKTAPASLSNHNTAPDKTDSIRTHT